MPQLLPCLLVTVLAAGLAAAERVDRVYQRFCAQCHGRDLAGGNANSLSDGQWQHAGSDEAIARVIREGLPDMGMMAFGETLSEEQIRGLVVLIREAERNVERRQDPPPRPRDDAVTATEHHRYRIEPVVERGLRIPWAVEPLGDGRLIVTERGGDVRLVAPDGTLGDPVADIPPVVARGQGGMLDVGVHPGFADNGWIYLSFSDSPPEARGNHAFTAVARGRIVDGEWRDHEWICRFDARFATGAGHHFGCRLVFHDGYVFWTTGDRGRGGTAQRLDLPNGSVFRLHDDGRIPADNPFVDRDDALPQIWSYGHRNPQGLVWHPDFQALYAHEHGPRGGDELNLVRKGANYGWPVITHGINYNGTPITAETEREGMEQPIRQWTPSPALCGMDVVVGDAFERWRGNLLIGSLKAQELRRVALDGEGAYAGEEIILTGRGRIRDVRMDVDGSILVLLNGPDRLVRLVPAD